MKFEKYYQELLELNVGTILKDEPLYKHTTYRVTMICWACIK